MHVHETASSGTIHITYLFIWQNSMLTKLVFLMSYWSYTNSQTNNNVESWIKLFSHYGILFYITLKYFFQNAIQFIGYSQLNSCEVGRKLELYSCQDYSFKRVQKLSNNTSNIIHSREEFIIQMQILSPLKQSDQILKNLLRAHFCNFGLWTTNYTEFVDTDFTCHF